MVIPEEAQMLHEHFRLSSANLQRDRAALHEVGVSLLHEGPDDRGAVRAAIKGGLRVVADLARERLDLAGGNIREIRDDEAVPAADGGKEIAWEEIDTACEAEARGVFRGQGQGVRGNIHGIDSGLGPFGSQAQGDDAAPGADVQDARRLCGEGQEEFDELLGLRTGDERPRIAKEGAAMEFHRPEEVLERLAGSAALHQDAERLQFALAQGAVEFQVQVNALLAEDVGQEVLRIEARAFDAMFLEVTGGGGDDFLHRFQQGSNQGG